MAKNKVLVTYELREDGSLVRVEKAATKAAKATDNLANKTEKASNSGRKQTKVNKGVAQTGLASAKSFSKTSQAIEGGLVPAYAALAARIFAVTALFGALQRASQVTQLIAGLSELGKASGLAMGSLSKGLQEATGYALSFEDAMRATASITSAGLDPSSINRFGEAAKNASNALGRDLSDSLSRLTRGITKLEPELLDELGIFVRLDAASKDYARSVNKSVGDLTNFEKRLAFQNATLDEADKKFGALAEAVKANPFDVLSATFANATSAVLQFISTAISPLISVIGNSVPIMIALMALVGSTIAGEVLGSLEEYAKKSKDMAKATVENMKSQRRFTTAIRTTGKTIPALSKSLQDGKATAKEFDAAVGGLTMSSMSYVGHLRRGNITQERFNVVTNQNSIAVRRLRLIQVQQNVSLAQNAQAASLSAIANGNWTRALRFASVAMGRFRVAIRVANAELTGLTRVVMITRVAFGALQSAATMAGAAISKMLGPISWAVMGIMFLYEGVTALIEAFKTDATKQFEKSITELSETQEELATNLAEVDKFARNQSLSISTLTARYVSLNNILDQFNDKYNKIAASGERAEKVQKAQREALVALLGSSKELTKEFGAYLATLESYSAEKDFIPKAQEFIKNTKKQALSVKVLEQTFQDAAPVISDYFNSLNPTSQLTRTLSALQDIGLATKGLELDPLKAAKVYEEKLTPELAKILGLAKELAAVQALTETAKTANEDPIKKIAAIDAQITALKETESSRHESNQSARYKKEMARLEGQIDKENEGIKQRQTASNEAAVALATSAAAQTAVLAEASAGYKEEEARISHKLGMINSEISLEKSRDDRSLASLNEQITLSNILINAKIQHADAQLEAEKQLLVNMGAVSTETNEYVNKLALVVTLINKRAQLDVESLKSGKRAVQNATRLVQLRKLDADLLKSKLNLEKSTGSISLASLKEQVRLGRELNDQTTGDKQITLDAARVRLAALAEEASAADANGQARKDLEREILILENNILQLNNERLTVKDETLVLAQGALAILEAEQATTSAILDLDKKRADYSSSMIASAEKLLTLNASAKNMSDPRQRTATLSAADEYEISKQMQEAKKKQAHTEFQLTMRGIDLEYALIDARYKILRAEAAVYNEKNPKAAQIDLGVFDTAVAGIESLKSAAQAAAAASFVNAFAGAENDTFASKLGAINEAKSVTGSTSDRIQGAFPDNTVVPEANTLEQVQSIGNILQPMQDQLRTMGPGGELIANAQAGMFAITESFLSFGQTSDGVLAAVNARMGTSFTSISEGWDSMKMEEKASIVASSLQLVGSALGALGQALADASANAISGIDKQIEREKALDGTSAASVAKLAGLEAKKEKMKRKAFETEKKMKMGMTVINTAAGIAQALASAPPPYSFILAGLIGAMGVAQLALISGTSYQGGGSAAGAAGPSSISVGSRSNSVDFSKSTSPSGELAFARGESGTGTGMSNFTPSGRAAGGNTAFMVGEQGPEMFVPERPGTILPADDAAKAVSSPINVSFNISAMDSKGVEDVLRNQRGQIIGMIREAANAHGETFLESVTN
jgi:hypothetical protein